MPQDSPDMGEQAISKVAEVGIASQLDEVEDVNVDIRTDPFKLMQGKVDSVEIEGHGMVMQKDLRMEEMEIHTGSIAINPMSVAFGKIELTQPTDAETHVVLNEADLNRAFNSSYIKEKMQGLEIKVNDQPMTVDTQQIEFRLPGEGKFSLTADILLRETNETKRVAFTSVPRMEAGGQRVSLEDIQYTEGQGLSPDLTQALVDRASELLDLRNFELEGMSLRLKHLNVQTGKLVLEAMAHVEQFPSS